MAFSEESENRQQCYQFKDTGACDYGDGCRFWHGDQAPGRDNSRRNNFNDDGGSFGGSRGGGVCFQFRDTGNCSFGDRCRFNHGDGGSEDRGGRSEDRGGRSEERGGRSGRSGGYGGSSYDRNDRGNDREQGGSKGICYDFRDNGNCRFGDRCRFSHDA